jgi:transposase
MAYSRTFRTRIVHKLMQPNAPTQGSVARETGVSQMTLSRWMQAARTMPAMADNNATKRRKWTAEEKLRIVNEASGLKDEALGGFLRREGVHETQLREWRDAARAGLASLSGDRKSPETQRVKQLEKELERKEKALAEVAALLVLRKKAQALWGDVDDDTSESSAK